MRQGYRKVGVGYVSDKEHLSSYGCGAESYPDKERCCHAVYHLLLHDFLAPRSLSLQPLLALCPLAHSHRSARSRGIRYPLAVLLSIATLAKLAEQNAPRAIADWAQLRAPALTDLFGLDRPTMPHATTWNRVFGAAVNPQQFSQLVADFLTAASATPTDGRRTRRRRGQIALCLDGKTLRGTIPAGKTRGVHLLAADLPEQGIVLVEVLVDGKENEIVTARTVLSLIDVRGCVVTGDAGALWEDSRSAGSHARFAAREAIISSVSRRIRRHCTATSPPSSPPRPCPRCPMIS